MDAVRQQLDESGRRRRLAEPGHQGDESRLGLVGMERFTSNEIDETDHLALFLTDVR